MVFSSFHQDSLTASLMADAVFFPPPLASVSLRCGAQISKATVFLARAQLSDENVLFKDPVASTLSLAFIFFFLGWGGIVLVLGHIWQCSGLHLALCSKMAPADVDPGMEPGLLHESCTQSLSSPVPQLSWVSHVGNLCGAGLSMDLSPSIVSPLLQPPIFLVGLHLGFGGHTLRCLGMFPTLLLGPYSGGISTYRNLLQPIEQISLWP